MLQKINKKYGKHDLCLSVNLICNKPKPVVMNEFVYARHFNNKDEKEQCKWKSNVLMAKKWLTLKHENDLQQINPLQDTTSCTQELSIIKMKKNNTNENQMFQ